VPRAASSPTESGLPARETTDSPHIIGKTTSEKKREQRKKRLLSKANVKRRSAAAMVASADAGPQRYPQQDLPFNEASADEVSKTEARVSPPTRPHRATSQPTVPEEYSRAKEIQRLKQARKDRANADRLEELRKANMEHMRERSRAKERRNKEFRPSSVNHSLGQMGGPLSSPVASASREQRESPRYSILDLASPSHNAAFGHGAATAVGVGPNNDTVLPLPATAAPNTSRNFASPAAYHNAADERPIRSRYSQEKRADASGGVRDLNPFRSGQEHNYSPDVRVARKQPIGSAFLGGDDDDDGYGWKRGEPEDIGNDSDNISDEYSDDDDHYEEDSDDFESDSADDSDTSPGGGGDDGGGGDGHNGRSKKPLQPRASKWVKMDEQEVLRRQDQGRRDAEEVAAQMRGVVGANVSTSSAKKPMSAPKPAPPITINASMRQSYQRMRDEHQESAEAGLGDRLFREVLEVYRSVAANGDAALDGVETQPPKRNGKGGKGAAKRRGKKRTPTKLMLRIMQIVGDDPIKLNLCTKIEELVFLEQAFLK
jgi:ribosomal protein L35